MTAIVKNLDAFITRAQEGSDTILAPRQLETFIKIRDFLNAGHTDGHVTKPTGIGKTVIFSKFLEAALAGLESRALVVGPTKIVLRQNRGRIDEFTNITAGAYYMHERDLNHQVTVTTYNSLRNLIKFGKINPKDYSILILDEAHRALGEETINAIDTFENSIRIGFTATPEFHEEKSVADILPFTIDEMSVREGVEQNLLAGLKVYVLTTGLKVENVDLKGMDFEEEAITKAINTPERNRFVAELYKDPRFYGKRTVVYAASRVHGRALTAAFEEAGIKIAYIDGLVGEDDREKILDQFKLGEVTVLCNVRVLVEGFDESEAEVCFNAVPTLSKVIAEQRGGRVLRRRRVRDSKMGIIVEILDEFGTSANTPVLFSEIAGSPEILSPSNVKELREKTSPKPVKVAKRAAKKPEPGELIEDPSVIMDLTNRNRRQRYTKMFEYAPRGWTHARRLAHELHVKESEIRSIAEVRSADKPDWFKRYLTSTDILVTHYHPRLADYVRRHFDKSLEGMRTPEAYADEVVLSPDRAEELLEAADQVTSTKAIRFADAAYFSVAIHGKVIVDEHTLAQQNEMSLIEEAEEEFWKDDDRTDEERERDYWNNFEPITSEAKGVIESEFEPDLLLHGDETDPFDDETMQPFVQDEPAIAPLGDSMRKRVRTMMQLLPKRYIAIVTQRILSDLTLKEVGAMFKCSRERIKQITNRALRLLSHRSHILYIWDHPIVDEDEWFFNQAPNPMDNEIYGRSKWAQHVLDDMEKKYFNRRYRRWSESGLL